MLTIFRERSGVSPFYFPPKFRYVAPTQFPFHAQNIIYILLNIHLYSPTTQILTFVHLVLNIHLASTPLPTLTWLLAFTLSLLLTLNSRRILQTQPSRSNLLKALKSYPGLKMHLYLDIPQTFFPGGEGLECFLFLGGGNINSGVIFLFVLYWFKTVLHEVWYSCPTFLESLFFCFCFFSSVFIYFLVGGGGGVVYQDSFCLFFYRPCALFSSFIFTAISIFHFFSFIYFLFVFSFPSFLALFSSYPLISIYYQLSPSFLTLFSSFLTFLSHISSFPSFLFLFPPYPHSLL